MTSANPPWELPLIYAVFSRDDFAGTRTTQAARAAQEAIDGDHSGVSWGWSHLYLSSLHDIGTTGHASSFLSP